MKVDVYFNLHKRVFSIRSCETGRVVAHRDRVFVRDATFVVQKAGREKVLREKRKNVHAFVRGEWTEFEHRQPGAAWWQLRYNPYQSAHFMDAWGAAIAGSPYVALTLDTNGKPYILAADPRKVVA